MAPRQGPATIVVPEPQPPAEWLVRVKTSTEYTEERGTQPFYEEFPYRLTDRSRQGRLVYEPVPGSGH